MSNTITQQVVQAAAARDESEASGDAAVVSLRTLMRGDATSANRHDQVMSALVAAGLVNSFTPEAFPALCNEDGSINQKKWDRTFTPQRLNVLQSFFNGLSYTETADALGMQVATVKSHTANLYRLFGVSSKVECIMQAVRFGVLPVPSTESAPRPRRRRSN